MRALRSLYYWVIALGYFGPVLFILLLRTFIQKPEQYDPWLRRRVITLFKILGSEPTVEFAETIPQDRPLIFMANHSSLIDIPLLKAVIPQYFIGIVAHDQMNYFLYGPTVRRIGSIPIHRNNIRRSLKSFKTARDMLEKGIHITVLPEGGRSKDGLLMPFKKLPFRFARDSNASIVPMAISGVFAMKNKGSLHLNPGQIVVRFGPVISAEKIASLEIEELMELTRDQIYSRLEPLEAGLDES